MIKKAVFTLINILSVLIIVAAVCILCIVLLTKPGQPPSVAGYTVLRVTTGSMAPTYEVDTLLLVKKTDPEAIQEGDVISFYSSDPELDGAVNTHRVTAVRKDGDHIVYTTKGDANSKEDSYEAFDTYLIGKVVGSSLILGKIARLASNPLIFVPIILLPLAVILISNIVRTVKLASKIAKDEEEQAVREMLQQMKEQRAANVQEEEQKTEDISEKQ